MRLIEAAGWMAAIAGNIGILLIAPASVAFFATLIVAAAWSIKVDHDEHRVQTVAASSPALNR